MAKNVSSENKHRGDRNDSTMRFDCIEKPLRKTFDSYGRLIARHPLWFLIGPLILTAVLGSGLYNFESEYNIERLFTPEGARSKDERSVIRSMYPEHHTSTPARMSSRGEFGRVIVTSKTDEGNVLTSDVFDEVEQLDRDIRRIVVDVFGTAFNYSELCVEGFCGKDMLIQLRERFLLKNLVYPIYVIPLPPGFTPSSITLFLGSSIGGVSTTSGGDTEARAWSLFYYLRSDDYHAEAVREWELKYLSMVAEKSYKHITVTRFSAHSQEDEIRRNADAVFPLFYIMLAVLMVFSVLSCMSADWVRSKPLLGNFGVISAALAVVSAFGLVLRCGVPFNHVVISGPFLVLGKSTLIDLVNFTRHAIRYHVPKH